MISPNHDILRFNSICIFALHRIGRMPRLIQIGCILLFVSFHCVIFIHLYEAIEDTGKTNWFDFLNTLVIYRLV